eukprot:579134-Rhodomonas_salina.2
MNAGFANVEEICPSSGRSMTSVSAGHFIASAWDSWGCHRSPCHSCLREANPLAASEIHRRNRAAVASDSVDED